MTTIQSTTDAIAAWYKHFGQQHPCTDGEGLSDPDKELLRRIEGMADAEQEAENLAGLAKALWVAQTSGELSKDDLENALWALHEFAHLVSLAVRVGLSAAHRLHEAEMAEAKARQKENKRRAG